jgi:hypothetical protein
VGGGQEAARFVLAWTFFSSPTQPLFMVASLLNQPQTPRSLLLSGRFLFLFIFLGVPFGLCLVTGKREGVSEVGDWLSQKKKKKGCSLMFFSFAFFLSGISFAWLLRKIEYVCEVGNWLAKI